MNLLNKLTINNLILNKKRTIVTIIGIMLSIALITAVSSVYFSGINSLIGYEKVRKGDFHVAYYNVLAEDIKDFKNNRSIDTINLVKNIGYAKINSKNEYKPYAFVKAFTKESLENLSIKLVEGRLPQNNNEILIPTHLKTNGRLDLKIGDTLNLEVGKRVDKTDGYELNQNNPYNNESNNEMIVDIINKEYKIVGIIERPANNIEEYSAPGYTFVTYMDSNDISGKVDIYAKYTKEGIKNLYNVTAGILEINADLFAKSEDPMYSYNSKDEHDAIEEEVNKAKYKININTYLIGLETKPLTSSGIGGLGIVAGIVILIIVFTSVFCIKNSFDISITEKIKQYGMLKSIGATKKQIRRNVFFEASILGIIGIPLGLLIGHVATYILLKISNFFLKDIITNGLVLELHISPIVIILTIVLGIITIYLSAFRSAKRAARTLPIDSIRNSAAIKINPKKIKSPKIIKKIFGMGGEISYKILKRNKKKYRTTVISIIVSVATFISLYSFMEMAFDSVANELNLIEANLVLSSRDYTKEEYDKMITTTTFDNIERYSILRQSDFECKENYYRQEYIDFLHLEFDPDVNHYFTIVALGKKEYNEYIKSLGLKYDEIKDKAIICDYAIVGKYEDENYINKYMKIHNLEKGSIITGKFLDEKICNIEIGKVTEEKPFGLENYNTYRLLIISDELFDKITTSNLLEIYYKSSNANKLQDDIDEFLKEDSYYTINNFDENAKIMNNLFILVGIFLYGFITVISLIGITNIFNTITTNMELRRQEFAMLKSIGMTKKEFNKMIRLESLFMGLKSLIIGIPIGTIFSYLIYYFLVKETGMPFALPIFAILLATCVVFVLIFIIMKYSINKINKQNIIDTIRNENI